jgi:transposase-like protein
MIMGRRPNQALSSVWKQRIARQRRSALSVAEFCRQEGCSPQSFYAWRRRLAESDHAPLRSSLFVPLELPVALPTRGVRIELPSGVTMTLPADASGDVLAAIVRAVISSASPQEQAPC